MRQILVRMEVPDFDPEYLAQVHLSPSGEDVEFNRLMVERANDGTLDTFGAAYNLPPGPVLVYKGLAATRREVTKGEIIVDAANQVIATVPVPDPQMVMLDVTPTGTISLAEIETEVAKVQAARNAKPRPPRKRNTR